MEINSDLFCQSGSNDNGNWIKFADGTMICCLKQTLNIACTGSWGDLYEGGSVSILFPETFTSPPSCMVTPIGIDCFIEGLRDVSTGSIGSIRVAVPNAVTKNFNFHIVAIGRWK